MHARFGSVAACGLVMAAAACGTSTGPGPAPSVQPTTAQRTPAQPTPAQPTTAQPTGSSSSDGSQLTVVVHDGAGATTTWTLTCDPVGGTHPQPDRACAVLEQNQTALDPVPEGKVCAQVYSGPERATITGTWRDAQVSASLSRVNSCETARWDALVPLLPEGGR